MAGRLEGKVAIVTGGASGIGLATAGVLAREGARVVIMDLRGAEDAAGAIGSTVTGMTVDVADQPAVRSAVADIVATHGALDVLHANASIRLAGDRIGISLEGWQQVLAVNLTGVFVCVDAVLPHMLDRGRGAIICTSSTAALRGVGSMAYSAAKAGVIGFARNVALQVAGKGVRINVICPGPIRTPMLEGAAADLKGTVEAGMEMFAEHSPMGFVGDPTDIGETVGFLASDAARFITGQVIAVDGGQTAK